MQRPVISERKGNDFPTREQDADVRQASGRKTVIPNSHFAPNDWSNLLSLSLSVVRLSVLVASCPPPSLTPPLPLPFPVFF